MKDEKEQRYWQSTPCTYTSYQNKNYYPAYGVNKINIYSHLIIRVVIKKQTLMMQVIWFCLWQKKVWFMLIHLNIIHLMIVASHDCTSHQWCSRKVWEKWYGLITYCICLLKYAELQLHTHLSSLSYLLILPSIYPIQNQNVVTYNKWI